VEASHTYCCERFAKSAGNYQAPVGGGFLYPGSARPAAQFERFKRIDSGPWAINGCCGGGCFVVVNMRFCPYCGTNIE